MSRKPDEDQHIKRMADLLRQGQTLTELACPVCASPLFRFKNGDLWCARCEKKVIVVKEGEEPTQTKSGATLDTLEKTLLGKLEAIQERIEHEQNAEELQKLNTALSGLLENLERIRKSRKK